MSSVEDFPKEMREHNEGNSVIASCSAFIVISAVTVVLRFWSRRKKRMPLGIDDWLILSSMPFTWISCVLGVLAVKRGGIGRYLAVVIAEDPRIFSRSLFYLFLAEFSYSTCLTLIKASILFLYFRIFPTKFMKKSCHAIGALCFTWWIVVVFVSLFQCWPIHKMWSPFMEGGRCMDQNQFFIGNAIPNIIIDVAILVLPVVEVKRLQMRRSLKMSILGIFLLGGGVVVVSCIRLSVVVRLLSAGPQGDFTLLMAPTWIWTNVEATMGMICASLPTMQPVLHMMFGRFSCFGTSTADKEHKSDVVTIGGSGSMPLNSRQSTQNQDGAFRRLHDNDSGEETMLWAKTDHKVSIKADEAGAGSSSIPLKAIRVQKDVSLRTA